MPDKLNELIDVIKKHDLKHDLDRIKRAYKFAEKAHDGQFRMSGEPYVEHPAATAKILASLKVDEETIIAGLLHDVPEDTPYTVQDLEKRFGKKVANLVSALTKLSKVYYRHSMGERQVQSLRKMFLQTADDPRVVIVKLADRLHNMSTLQYLRPDKQQRIARETLKIYAPLANLYGIYQLRRQLEDFCFMYLQPEEYARIKAFVHDHEKRRERFVKDSIKVMSRSFKKAGLDAEFEGRPKHFYSIYQKMIRDQKKLSDIYDYFAIRVIVQNPEDCYQAIGIIHNTFKPKLGRFKDYIALPKPNGYQSLHTTVVGLRGQLTEIQVRTKQMHREAEFGAAAHVVYKGESISYLTESIEQLKKYKNPESFIQGLQEDVLQDRIYVFSPSGDIINLPQGATCLDYVYAVDLPVDTKVFRAVVNRKNYSLIGELQSGDHVEIVYGEKKQSGPKRWWLEHVKTARAKKNIRDFFKKKSLKTKVQMGEQLLQQELDHENAGLIYTLSKKKVANAVKAFDAENFEELLSKIGEGSLKPEVVYQSMFPDLQISRLVLLVRWLFSFKRFFKLEPSDSKYRIRIVVEAYDRVGLLKEMIEPFYELSIPILKIRGTGYDIQGNQKMQVHQGTPVPINPKYINKDIFDVNIESHEELIALFDRLEKIPGVIRVQRAFRRKQISFILLAYFTLAYFIAHPFLMVYLRDHAVFSSGNLGDIVTYFGLFSLFAVLLWLTSMGNKTFPHFGETKYFWPLAFVLTSFCLAGLALENYYLNLELQTLTLAISYVFIIVFLLASYFGYRTRRRRYLNLLKSSQKRALKRAK